MTICELIVIPLVIGIVCNVVSTYIVKFLDKEHKNNRHEQ